MKKTFVLLMSLLSLGSLFAQVYSSNMLGQKLEPLGGIPAYGYALEEDGSVSILYLDGVPVKKTERIEIGNEICLFRSRSPFLYKSSGLTPNIADTPSHIPFLSYRKSIFHIFFTFLQYVCST